MNDFDDNDPYEDIPQAPEDQWVCQSCGHQFTVKWPKDRAAYYRKPYAKRCPKCKSEDASPTGF